jgi:hypothetical protein
MRPRRPEFFRKGEPHSGILIVTRSILATRPEPLAYALLYWCERTMACRQGARLEPYYLDLLNAPATG